MAQYVMNAYDADVYIPEFRGLMQYGDQMGGDLRYSPDCNNIETPAGVLQPVPKLKNIVLKRLNGDDINAADECQMMYVRQRNNLMLLGLTMSTLTYVVDGVEQTFSDYALSEGEEYDAFLFAIGPEIYRAFLPVNFPSAHPVTMDNITEIYVTRIAQGFLNRPWSWCSYESTYGGMQVVVDGEVQEGDPVNIIVLSSDKNGCKYYMPPNDMISDIDSAPDKFRFVARYAERIWGVGNPRNKDRLYYSRPYDALDWSGDSTDPANGGGEIREPTFDNDQLVALVPFGDALIAFSELRAWRITGSDPSNFSIQEQYGNGTRYPRSIAVMGDRIIMLGEHGLVAYDGYRVVPFMKEATYEIFREMQVNPNRRSEPVAIVTENKYVLALSNHLSLTHDPLDFRNTGFRLLIYDGTDGSITTVDAPMIVGVCGQPPYAWATVIDMVDEETDRAALCRLRFDSWYLQEISGRAVKWVTPWVTFGRKDIQKGGFDMYFSPELGENAEDGVTFRFSIQTEKKTKTKTYRVAPLTAAQKAAGKKYRQKKLHFGGTGRRFRFMIEVAEGNTVPWRLIGGIHIIAETDKD